MDSLFNDYFLHILKEASTGEEPPMPPSDDNNADEEENNELENLGGDDMEVEQVFPEELELAKFAIRALYFNVSNKDLSKVAMKYNKHLIAFYKIPDFFEKTKKGAPVLDFIEQLMDEYEGMNSKWTDRPEVKGKSILEKIRAFNAVAKPEEKLDNGKRMLWIRIIINCLFEGQSDFNINTSDVDEDTIHEIFNLLKMHYGHDTRGLLHGMDFKGPGNN
jgi:hypothetical protein